MEEQEVQEEEHEEEELEEEEQEEQVDKGFSWQSDDCGHYGS